MTADYRGGVRGIVMAAALASSSLGMWAATKGPDAGGYRATDEVIYSFTDISGASGGVGILSGTDDGTSPLNLPFTFHFYGSAYSWACVSTNGAMYLVPSASACSGFESDFANTDVTATPVPNDRAAILPLWTDLTFQVPGAGAVFYQTLGAAPARRFIVQWNNAYPQGATSPVTFQAILSEGSNGVLFQYKNVGLGPGEPARNGAHATVGIRNAGSPANNQHLEWSFNAPVLTNESALAFAFTAAPSDTIGPAVIVLAPATLWPPNGKTVVVKVRGTITDTGAGVDLSSGLFAVKDEYGDVQPAGRVAIAANGSYSVNVPLVARRHGHDRDGRLYTITITAKDKSGNRGSATTIVIVPHSHGR
jgi:hypothetical protein